MPRLAVTMIVLVGFVLAAPSADGQDPSVARAAQALRSRSGNLATGESALVGLALAKADVPPDDPGLAACLAKVGTRFTTNTYTPELASPGGHSIYEASVIALFYATHDPVGYKDQIDTLARYLIQNQMANGGWDYGHRMNGPYGDTSISQYAVLGLWEAENVGARVPAQVWDKAARWFLSKQSAAGGWNYHRDEGKPDTISMTAAGVGSLLICKRQLTRQRATTSSEPVIASSLLKPVLDTPEATKRYTATTSTAAINNAVSRGLQWLSSHWTTTPGTVMGESIYYGLYGIERIVALAGEEQQASADWFERGRQYIISTQLGDGSWNANYSHAPNTAWAVLFLTRSTEKSVRRVEVERLGAGTLIGGRGLPEDLRSLTIAGGQVLVRPMNGAIDEMVAVLEDPRAEGADEALAGLVTRYHREGPAVLKPHKSRFAKLLADPDPGIRGVAAWALGRTGDLDVAPDLIVALEDPEERVVSQARDGLRLLSRKLDGYGPPIEATPEEKRAAARSWLSWFESIRVPDFAAPVDRP